MQDYVIYNILHNVAHEFERSKAIMALKKFYRLNCFNLLVSKTYHLHVALPIHPKFIITH